MVAAVDLMDRLQLANVRNKAMYSHIYIYVIVDYIRIYGSKPPRARAKPRGFTLP